MKSVGLNPLLAVILMLLLGLGLGVWNGIMTAYVGLPAFIATLGTQYICYGVAKLITNATPIPKMPEEIGWLGRGYIGPVPICVILMVVLYIVAQFIMDRTKLGRNLYAVGGSSEAAFFSGINVKNM